MDALTGPLSRGDVATIAGHLEALAAEAPDVLPVYRALGLATLDLVAARGRGGQPIAADELLAMQDSSARPADPQRPCGIADDYEWTPNATQEGTSHVSSA